MNSRNVILVSLLVISVVYNSSSVGLTIDFEDQFDGVIVNNQYQSQGVIFSSVDFNPDTLLTSPVYDGVVIATHWVSSGQLSIEPTRTGVFQSGPFPNFPALQMEFVLPGTNTPATTDYVSLHLDTSTNDGNGNDPITIYAFDLNGFN